MNCGGPRNHVFDGVQIPMGKCNFEGKGMPRHLCREPCNKSSAVAEMGDRLAIDMGRQAGALCPFPWGTWVSIYTMSSGPTSVSCGILIHPTVWPQYTNVTVLQTGQTGRQSRSIGRNVICNGHPKTAEPMRSTCRLVSGVEWAE